MPRVKKCQPKHLGFPKAFKSFLGYLEGTRKAAHTIKNYRLDLEAFQSFLQVSSGSSKPIRCENLGAADLEDYHGFLKSQGFKTNTRRRKLLTAQRFLKYLSQRNQLNAPVPDKMPAPHKIERIPFTVPQRELIAAIAKLPAETVLERRNRALLRVLAETGCLVSEAAQLQFSHWEKSESGRPQVTIPGKASRALPVSGELFGEIQGFRLNQEPDRAQADPSCRWLFQGFNRHGALGGPITSRGIELLVRFYASRLGFQNLTPRTFRHSTAVAWFEQGVSQPEIQRRLGLKTAYAFRSYLPLIQTDQSVKSSSETTSTS